MVLNKPLELWLDARHTVNLDEVASALAYGGFDKVLVTESAAKSAVQASATGVCNGLETLVVEEASPTGSARKIYASQQRLIGASMQVLDASSQQAARAVIGSVEWLHVDARGAQPMIVAENLIGACEGTPTRISATVDTAGDAPGLAFALSTGVDALCIVPTANFAALVEAAQIAKAQRAERIDSAAEAACVAARMATPLAEATDKPLQLCRAAVRSVVDGGVADRVCLDFTTLLSTEEGCLVGSSAKALALVLGETVASGFVPPRPFRCNAGPVHSYVLMADGSAKYLSEVRAGDAVLVAAVDNPVQHGHVVFRTRVAIVGRAKVEPRPTLLINFDDQDDCETVACDQAATSTLRTGSVFLQQAETVRLAGVTDSSSIVGVPVTAANQAHILVRWTSQGTHVGQKISARVEER